MLSLIVILVGIGSYGNYALSKRMSDSTYGPMGQFLRTRPVLTPWLSLLALALAWGLTVIRYGLGAGSMYYLVVLMLMLSLIILIAPLNIFRWTHLLGLGIFSICIELILF